MITLEPDGSVTGELTGSWQCADGQTFRCVLNGIAYDGVMNPAYNDTEKVWTVCFTALDETGAALWGTRRVHPGL